MHREKNYSQQCLKKIKNYQKKLYKVMLIQNFHIHHLNYNRSQSSSNKNFRERSSDRKNYIQDRIRTEVFIQF